MAQKQIKPSKPKQKKPEKRILRGHRVTPKATSALKLGKFQQKLRAKNIQNLEQQMAVKALSSGKLKLIKAETGDKKD